VESSSALEPSAPVGRDPSESSEAIARLLGQAQLLVEIGEIADAERVVLELLERSPEELDALNLLAMIKHIRGELSQAVACWAQLHMRSPHNETALMTIGAILDLARDPEKSAGEFLALGHLQLARKPAAILELEAAFRPMLARRPAEARDACARLANRYRVRDPSVFKLAMLANAYFAELSGDLEAARKLLEQLGTMRGFETDTDRILSLARVYEKLGQPTYLEKAAHIFRFIERTYEKISVKSRLAVLYRRLGRNELAAEYEAHYLRSFRRRMHRLTTADIARAASLRYVPLSDLRSAQAVDKGEVGATPRERALATALEGDVEEARAMLTGEEDPLSQKYRADLDAAAGHVEIACRRFLDLVRGGEEDIRVLRWLLTHHAETQCGQVAAHFASPVAAAAARPRIEAALKLDPVDARCWRDLARVLAIAGDEREAERCNARALALEEAARRDANAVGRVLAAAVYHFVGKTKGLVHQIWVTRKAVGPGRGGSLGSEDILGNVTAEMRQGIRNTFLSVREYARSRFPEHTADILDYDYAYKITKEDEPSGGLSAGLPTALAFLSVFLQRPVPQDIAASGVLIADAHDALTIRAVGESEYKVKGAYNRRLRAILLPAENKLELMQSTIVPRALCDTMVRFVHRFDDAVRFTFGDEVWLT
jgi:predicted Zn-dependent protease